MIDNWNNPEKLVKMMKCTKKPVSGTTPKNKLNTVFGKLL